MRADPPAELVGLLGRLRLATAAQVNGVFPSVKRLAGDLPLFSSVWVDALAQARVITPFQAAEINASRGERLAVGPFVLTAPLQSLGYADAFRAREAESRRSVHLLVATSPEARNADFLKQIAAVIDRTSGVKNRFIQRTEKAGGGADGNRIWIAYSPTDARPLRDVVQQTGRLSGEAVLEIARQLTAALAELETAGIVHGDLSLSAILIGGGGLIQLARCGVRGILRPEEGFAHADLQPEAYDYLAPERVVDAALPGVASDLFACGCVWWHLLTGRPPLAGGTSLGKLRAAQMAKIQDVRRFAADAPPALVAAIAECTQRDPQNRPESFEALAAMLGPPTPAGRRAVEQAVARTGGEQSSLITTVRGALRSKDAPAWMATIAGCLAVIATVSWPLWHSQPQVQIARNAAQVCEPRPLAEHGSAEVQAHAQKPKRSDFVEPATFVEPAAGKPAVKDTEKRDRPPVDRDAAAHSPPPLILPGGKLTSWNSVEFVLRAGQTVRGQSGERPMIAVPPSGIVVAVEDARFENVDFVWSPAPDAAIDPEHLVLLELRAARASFHGCTFQAATSERIGRPTAICWNGSRRTGPLPPAGRLQIVGCVFAGVATGIDCRPATPLALSIADTLHLGPGPLLRLDHVPRTDEPIEIELAHSTLRDAAALVGFHVESGGPPDEPGTIGMTTNDCVLAPNRGGALVLFAAPRAPTRLAKSFQWSGEGSLLSADARVGVWLKAAKSSGAEEIEVPVDGLASSAIEFAGPADAGSSASRVTRWLAPVQSVDPPGIPEGLPNLPRLP